MNGHPRWPHPRGCQSGAFHPFSVGSRPMASSWQPTRPRPSTTQAGSKAPTWAYSARPRDHTPREPSRPARVQSNREPRAARCEPQPAFVDVPRFRETESYFPEAWWPFPLAISADERRTPPNPDAVPPSRLHGAWKTHGTEGVRRPWPSGVRRTTRGHSMGRTAAGGARRRASCADPAVSA